jgi:AcrR family transcriptional regulator
MMKDRKVEAKQRIFDAALALFAQKGYDAVGIREIAKAASVNISMINYYYHGKIGILKAMVNECYEKYYEAVGAIYDEKVAPEDVIRIVIKKVIDFHRNNWNLLMVAMHTTPVDIPEILDLKCKWVATKQKGTFDFFARLGLDTKDIAVVSAIRGVLTTLIGEHFQFRHVWEHILKSQGRKKCAEEHDLRGKVPEFDDAYYEKYAEALAVFYLHGVSGLSKKQ